MNSIEEIKSQCNNRLLALLPGEEFEGIAPSIEVIPIEFGQAVTKRNEPIKDIYFPYDCIASILWELESGQSVEISAVGNEGMTSVMGFLSGEIAINTMICQVAGKAARLPIDTFRNAIKENTEFRKICQKYAQIYLSTACQSMACNRFHKVEQRLSRWLLMTHDRVGCDEFPITQEVMAIMLGTERPSVSTAAKPLRDHEIIFYNRGKMKILNREALEEHACECYRFTRMQFKNILGIEIG